MAVGRMGVMFRLACGWASIILAVLFCTPLVVVGGMALNLKTHDENGVRFSEVSSVGVAGHSVTGWQMWATLAAFAGIGVAFLVIGISLIKSQRSSGR